MHNTTFPVRTALTCCPPQIAPIFWLLSLLRTYRFLAFTSILGDIAVTAGIISVVVYGATQHTFKFDLPQFEVNSFPKFIGSTSFLFAIHIVVRCARLSEPQSSCYVCVSLRWFTLICVVLVALFPDLAHHAIDERCVTHMHTLNRRRVF